MNAEGETQPNTPVNATGTLTSRIRRSFDDSVGSIVFGMEDGTVSIFGLVFGVAAAAPNSHAVLLAGATGAVAAAVSMMAGTFLDVESTNDQAAARLAEVRARFDANRRQEDQAIHHRLVSAGFSDNDAGTVIDIVGRHPETGLKIAAAVDLGLSEATKQSPVVQSASVPVVPFAFFALTTARWVSLAVTSVLLVLLGVGRSAIGHRPVLSTVAETIGIAALAAVAGVGVGVLIS